MAKKNKVGTCALCRNENVVLEESHVIPKFVFRHLKRNAFGNIRSVNEPNKVVQDGEKDYMLCGVCEDRFNKAETLFAGKIFRPYLIADESRFEYDEWLQYFIVSVNWRNLYLDIIGHVNDHDIDISELQVLTDNEAIMRAYLLDERQDIGTIENHLFFFGDIKSASREISSLSPHLTMRTSYCGYTIRNSEEKTIGTISNLLGIVMVTIYQKGKNEEWSNTQVLQDAGVIEAKDQQIKSIFSNELMGIMKNAKESSNKLSDKQRQKIEDKLRKNKEKYIKSLAFKQRMKDYALDEDV